MANVDEIAANASNTVQSLVHEAFEAGRAVGRSEAAAEFKARLAALLGESDIPTESLPPAR